MRWNWQQPEWPDFRFSPKPLAGREAAFLHQSGVVVGTLRHFPDEQRLPLIVELLGTEALKTSEIEGEILSRDSVQSSLRRQFGLQADARQVPPAEQGIAETGRPVPELWCAARPRDAVRLAWCAEGAIRSAAFGSCAETDGCLPPVWRATAHQHRSGRRNPSRDSLRLAKDGRLVRLARGLYRLAEAEEFSDPDLVVAALKSPGAVVCLISALAFRGITTQIPRAVHLAVPRGKYAGLRLRFHWRGGVHAGAAPQCR